MAELRSRLAVALLVLLAVAVPASAAHTLGQHFTVASTAYDLCSSGPIMADGRRVHTGAVANNMLPLGTVIRMDRPIGMHDENGRWLHKRYFRVEDRIGSASSQLDIWHARCSESTAWGRRIVGFRVVIP
jgi:3D (Asp-Asp-Asp) domain-containing protein